MNEKKESFFKKNRYKVIFATLVFLPLFIFWFFILDLIVERFIESEGTKAVGARVELASADVSLFPFGIDLFRLQVTNSQQPVENSIEIGHIRAIVEIFPLIKQKIIVNEVLFDKVRFNTLREQSGAISQGKNTQVEKKAETPEWLRELCQQNGINLFEMPDVDNLLKNEYESLESVKIAKDIQNNISNAEKTFKKKLESLIDEEKLEEYRARIDKIRENDSSSFAILGSVLELREIYKEIEDELDDIHDVKKEFKRELDKFQKDLKKLSAARLSDIERLKNKYSFLNGETFNIAKLLFGQSLCLKLEKYSNWIALVEPYFDLSTEEDDTHKPEKQDTPASSVYFLVQNIKANILLKNGVLTGKAANITNMPTVTGVPTTFNFAGKNFQGLDLFDFKGIMNLVDSMHPHHEVNLNVSGLLLENFEFSDKPDLSMALVKSLINIVASFKLDDNKFKLLAKTQFNKVVMHAESVNGSDLQKILAKTLTDIDQFNLSFDLTGVDDKYNTSIRSDLDSLFNKLVANMFKTRVGTFEKDLKTGVLRKTATPMKNSNKSFMDFSRINEQLSGKSDQSMALLNEIN